MKLLKKIVKLSMLGGALGAAYGAGRMNQPKPVKKSYIPYLRKGSK